MKYSGTIIFRDIIRSYNRRGRKEGFMKFVILYLVCGFVLSQISYKIEREGLIRKSDKEWFETLELDLPLKWKAL